MQLAQELTIWINHTWSRAFALSSAAVCKKEISQDQVVHFEISTYIHLAHTGGSTPSVHISWCPVRS